MNKNRSFRFSFPRKGEFKVLADILRTGLPKALTQLTSFLRSIVLNALVMFSLGSIGMSVMTVCINVLMISGIFVGGTSDALLPIVGTLFGERDYYGIRQTVKSAYRVLAAACLCLMASL
jgi:Na+-driven multidrug efflux pump